MIGIVLVSHSKPLAAALRELVAQMVGPEFPIVVAAGVGDDHDEIGTDAVHIAEVLRPFCDGDGAVVLMDLGSAVLSAQTALELLEADGVEDPAAKIRLCAGPFVEAAVAASVLAKAGGSPDAVAAEAMTALAAKADQLGESAPAPAPAAESPAAEGGELAFEVTLDLPHGLHARPAANLVQAAGRFRSRVTVTNLTGGRGPTSAASLTGIGLLQARLGDRVRIGVSGPDAEDALRDLRRLAEERFGETEPAPAGATAPPAPVPAAPATAVPVSEGIAVGRPLPLTAALPEPDAAEEGPAGPPDAERQRLHAALDATARAIREAAAAAGGDAAKILAAQALMLSDPDLLARVEARIAAGESAPAAWRVESLAVAAAYAAMEDDYLRARAADLSDISARVVRVLAGSDAPLRIAPEPPAILLADELLPGEAMACDPERVLGVLAKSGSPTAHAAILIRSLGIPMVIRGDADTADLAAAGVLAIDGATGEAWADPGPALLAGIEDRRRAFLAERAAFEAGRDEPARTRDGTAVEILVNVGNAADAARCRASGADGVGLLRTEFVYMGFSELPDDDAQTRALAAVLAPLGPGPVVVRTPDIGADKPLPFIPQSGEHNPFLGVRGIRLSFRRPEFFASNLRAILRAGVDSDLWIMFPMVSAPDEMRQGRACVEAAHRDLQAAGVPHRWPVRIGMMVEVPAAALAIERFVPHADFFSIGTNDLTQYVLAAERGNGDLNAFQDAAHPAVLGAIARVCAAADAAGRHVSVCGDAASDPVAAALMIGAGVRSLSVRINQVAAIKAAIRKTALADLRRLARDVPAEDGAAEARRLAAARLAAG